MTVGVVCNGLEAEFLVRAGIIIFPRGSKKVYSPRDFEVLAGQGHYKNWKQSIRIDLTRLSIPEQNEYSSNHDNNAPKGVRRGIPVGKWMKKRGLKTNPPAKKTPTTAAQSPLPSKRKITPPSKFLLTAEEPGDTQDPSLEEGTRKSSRVAKSVYSKVRGKDGKRFRSLADLTGKAESSKGGASKRIQSPEKQSALLLAKSILGAWGGSESGLFEDAGIHSDPEESEDVLDVMGETLRKDRHFGSPRKLTASALDLEIENRLEELRTEERRVRKAGIRGLLRNANAFRLQPFRYMISWNGVLVLAFTGFPRIVLKLKNNLNKFEHLVNENSGSTWPKCTLAALNDNQRLSPEQLQRLNSICLLHNCKGILNTLVGHEEYVKNSIGVKSVHLTVYECRNHERVLTEEEFCLKEEDESPQDSEEDEMMFQVDKKERERIFKLCEETRDVNKYWFHASKDGNRISHYREPKIGSSLVTWLNKAENAGKLLEDIRQLRHKIEQEFPDLYTFFNYDSLHVTLRAVS